MPLLRNKWSLIIFLRSHDKNLRLGYDLLILVNVSDFAISRGFYFHETSHPRGVYPISQELVAYRFYATSCDTFVVVFIGLGLTVLENVVKVIITL